MAKKIRVGFIATGGIAPFHFHRLKEAKRAELVALTEPDPKMYERFCAHCPGAEELPLYTNYLDMLKNEQLDAVEVLTPHDCHYDQVRTCMSKGLHVLTEKPMVCSIKHAKALIAHQKKTGVVLAVSYQRHCEPTFRYMRDQILKGKIGEIEYVQALLSQEWLRATAGTWRQQIAHSLGGQLNDSGSHMVDILLWVTGLQVKEVSAVCENFGTEVDINSALTLSFKNGAMGNMSIIGNAPSWYEDHTIIGSKGAFYLRNGNLLQQDAKGKPVKVKLPKYTKTPDTNFIDCILGKDVPQAPPECGLRVMEVTEAAWRSAASGKPVRLR